MTNPLAPPIKKDPRRRTQVPLLPPAMRSRAAKGLSVQAGLGTFRLQNCTSCGAVAYPPRDACPQCLSVALQWRDTDPTGALLAQTITRVSTNSYFRDQVPLRIGTIAMAAGPSVVAHLHNAVTVGDTVRLALYLEKSGQGVMIALPQQETIDMADDPMLRELTADPKHRRILITDGAAPYAPALIDALLKAGAAKIFVGQAERWLPDADAVDWSGVDKVETVPLDVTDEHAVVQAAGSIAGKVDILINTARHVRPGGVLGQGIGAARDEIEVNVLGLMRLAQAFGPAMAARGADGVNSAVAWVNVLSVFALSAAPEYGSFAASQAAARAVAQTLRAELRGGGIRVMDVLVGPTDDAWHQELPAPKVAPAALARDIVAGLVRGQTEITCGDIARDIADRWRADADLLALELSEGTLT